jgi:hypothetical protein
VRNAQATISWHSTLLPDWFQMCSIGLALNVFFLVVTQLALHFDDASESALRLRTRDRYPHDELTLTLTLALTLNLTLAQTLPP